MPSIALTLSVRGQLLSGTRIFSPISLFAANEPGLWLDPSDLTTMFQDTAGTTPVTTAGQTVALALDKSKGLVLGSERMVNGTFDTNLTGWTVGTDAAQVIPTWTASGVSLTRGAGGPNGFSQSSVAQAGKTYLITFDVVSGTVAFDAFGVSVVAGGAGSKRFIYTANSTPIQFWPTSNNATAVIDNISVKELPGAHATQATAASRPTYGVVPSRGRVNLLERTEGFGDVYWNTAAVTVAADQTAAPTGAVTADRITKSSVAFQSVFRTGVVSVAGQTYTVSAYFKSDTFTRASIAAISGTNDVRYWFDLSAKTVGGAIGSFTTGYVGSAIEDVGNGWVRCSLTITAQSTQIAAYFYPDKADNAVAGSIFLWGAQLETGSTATNYQRVGSAFDVTEAGVPSLSYLSFDGVDDFLVTPTITPGIDKAQVFAGVRKLSDAAIGAVLETSDNSNNNNGAIWLLAPGSPGSNQYSFRSKGTASSDANVTGYTAPITNVITGIGGIADDASIIRVNGAQVGSSAVDQGTGNFLAYPLYIGRRGGTTLPFNGNIFSLVVRFGANLDAGTITSTEQFVGGKTGVTIP